MTALQADLSFEEVLGDSDELLCTSSHSRTDYPCSVAARWIVYSRTAACAGSIPRRSTLWCDARHRYWLSGEPNHRSHCACGSGMRDDHWTVVAL